MFLKVHYDNWHMPRVVESRDIAELKSDNKDNKKKPKKLKYMASHTGILFPTPGFFSLPSLVCTSNNYYFH